VSLLVDASVWSLALRRDSAGSVPEVDALRKALTGGDVVVTTGLVPQELLQGFAGPQARAQIIERFATLPLLQPIATITCKRPNCARFVAGRACKSGRSTLSWRNHASGIA
jgi:predicted nucleic acid-binding protein